MCKFLIQSSVGKLSDNDVKQHKLIPVKSFKDMDDFLNNLIVEIKKNKRIELLGKKVDSDGNLIKNTYLKMQKQKIENYNKNLNKKLNIKECIPAYLRYLGDKNFFKIIYDECGNSLSEYIKFWKKVKSKKIHVKIHSTLFGWIDYNDFIPYYSAENMYWEYTKNLELEFKFDNYYNLLSNTTNKQIGYTFGINAKEKLINKSALLSQRAKWFVKMVNECNCKNN